MSSEMINKSPSAEPQKVQSQPHASGKDRMPEQVDKARDDSVVTAADPQKLPGMPRKTLGRDLLIHKALSAHLPEEQALGKRKREQSPPSEPEAADEESFLKDRASWREHLLQRKDPETARCLFVEGKPVMSRTNILNRIAQISEVAEDNLLCCDYIRLANHTRLHKSERARLRVPGLLSGLLEEKMRAWIQGELEAYLPRLLPFDPSRGVSIPGMFHSLIQQVIREDPLHYLLMVAMQPKGEHKLQSYPLCVDLQPGDEEEEEEEEEEGFCVRLSENRPPKTCFKLTDTLAWSKSPDPVAITFRIPSVMVPCQEMEELYGLSAADVRRLNEECLIPEQDGDPKQKHPAAIRFPHCSPIGAAIAGAIPWDSEMVEFEIRELFGSSLGDATAFVKRTRRRISAAWKASKKESEHRLERI